MGYVSLVRGGARDADGPAERKRISVVDDVMISPEQEARLHALGEARIYADRPADEEELLERIGEAEIVVVSATPISARVIREARNLELIAIWSTGYNHVDVAEATRQGVFVCNVVAGTARSVAEHGVALMLGVAKRLGEADRYVRQGGYAWDALPATELQGKTCGIVGTGSIGGHIATMARGIGMRVIACTKNPSPERAAQLGLEFVALPRLLEESDVICLCAALTPETEGMIGSDEFAMMIRHPILVNVARGQLIDQEALVEALHSGQIRGAGLDVLEHEPPELDEPLLAEGRVILTPHMGGFTPEAMANLTNKCLDNVAAFIAGTPQRLVS